MRPSNTNTQQVERDIDAGNANGQGIAEASAEQAADLAALEAAAGGQPQPGGAVATVEPEEQGPSKQEEIAALMGMAVAALSPILPSLKAIYTPETIGAASGAIGALCDKHGWLEGGVFGKYGAEIACAAVVGPLAWATYHGVRADLAEHAKRRPIEAVAAGGGIDLDAPIAPAAPVERTGPAVTFGSAPA